MCTVCVPVTLQMYNWRYLVPVASTPEIFVGCNTTLLVIDLLLMEYTRSSNGRFVAVVNALLPKTKIGEHKHYYAFQLLLITRDVDALLRMHCPSAEPIYTTKY